MKTILNLNLTVGMMCLMFILCRQECKAQWLAAGNETICYGGDPGNISFSVLWCNSCLITYQWYFKDGIANVSPSDGLTGWTIIPGAIGSSYNPPAGLTSTRTYACRCSRVGYPPRWANRPRQVTVLSPVTYGAINPGPAILWAGAANPDPIMLSYLPSGGSGTFTYQWYSYFGITSAPTGSNVPAGWTLIPSANSSTYDPPLQYHPITFALRVDPIGTPDCSGPRWASFQYQVNVDNNPGTIASGNQTLCSPANPDNITFSILPAEATAFQWYFKVGINPAPGSYDPLTSWVPIAGATGTSYNPPAGLESSRTYACRITLGGVGMWSDGVRQITVNNCSGISGFVEQSEVEFTDVLHNAKLGLSYPNPANENLNITFELPEGSFKSTIILYELNGREVMREELPVLSESNRIILPVQNLAPGIYVYALEINGVRCDSRRFSIDR